MTRQGSRTSRTPTIYLIAEDITGEMVFREIIRKRRIGAHIKPLGRARGVSTLASEIKGLIESALQERRDHDCIIVLHDTDASVQRHRKDYKTIERICKPFAGAVTRLQAVDEIESWLLADDDFCAWLGEKPKAADHIPQPSKEVERLINAKFNRRMWTNREKPKILADHFSVTGDKIGRSRSMKEAMDNFLELPCTQHQS